MSKNRRNYSKMYTGDIEETPEVVPEEEPIANLPDEEESKIEPLPMLEGTIVDCEKLNIRNVPDMSGEIVTVLPKGTKLMVEQGKLGDWYKICTLHGIEGFCMSKYINIKK